MAHRLARCLAPALLALLLAGCASGPSTRQATPAESSAAALAAAGRHAEAAAAWRAIAEASRGDEAARARLEAAEAFSRAGDLTASQAELAASARRRLPAEAQTQHDLVGARLALAARRPAEALALLQQPASLIPPARRGEWLALRAEALEGTGDRFGAAVALAALANEQAGAERADTLRRAERQLKGVADAPLREQVAFLDAESPVLPLALREARRRGIPVDRQAGPAAPEAPGRPGPAADGYHPPARMAVLLPLSGELAAAGHAVRDGLLAGYYSETRARPPLEVIDTGGTAAGARAARDRALAAGADLIVGPLGRDEVAALAETPTPGARWLALNRTPIATPGGGSFALAPEDEGAAVAQRLLDRGLRLAVALAEGDDTAQRGLVGFRERFVAGGGELLGVAALDALGGTAAESLGRLSPHAGRAQALFIAARAPAVRILMPQREAAGLHEVPVFATSLVQTGSEPRLDRELEGLQYPELPWLLGDAPGPGDAEDIGRRLPTARGAAARLFAFGFDAWNVAAYLEALRNGAQWRGATGELGIDAAGLVERRPGWAEYSGGLTRRASDGALMPIDAPPLGALPAPGSSGAD